MFVRKFPSLLCHKLHPISIQFHLNVKRVNVERYIPQTAVFNYLTNPFSQSIFTHARQRIQAGEELQSAQSAIPEPEVESEKEASDGEDEDDDNVDTVRKRPKRNSVKLF